MILKWLHDHFGQEKGKVLALGGGGARGIAHVGIIQVLEENNWKPDLVTGTSMGAVIGALYAMHGNAGKVEEHIHDIAAGEEFKKFDFEKIVRPKQGGSRGGQDFTNHVKHILLLTRLERKQAILSSQLMNRILDQIFGELTFDNLQIPFVAIATDLISGEDIEIREGLVAEAVAASSSIPGVFTPVKKNGMLLVDGCVTKNIPVPDPEDSERFYVVAVDVLPHLFEEGPFHHALDILNRADRITRHHLNQTYLAMADEVIVPDVRHVHWADFSRIDELIQVGRVAAEKHLENSKKNNEPVFYRFHDN